MIVYIKPLSAEFEIALECELTHSIENVKEAIEKLKGVPAQKQRLIFAGKQLEDGQTLAYYGIQHESTLHCTGRLYGGGGIAEVSRIAHIHPSVLFPVFD
jgi:hypothetical protein